MAELCRASVTEAPSFEHEGFSVATVEGFVGLSSSRDSQPAETHTSARNLVTCILGHSPS